MSAGCVCSAVLVSDLQCTPGGSELVPVSQPRYVLPDSAYGTVLWDVGYYTIDYPGDTEVSDSEEMKRLKRRKLDSESES